MRGALFNRRMPAHADPQLPGLDKRRPVHTERGNGGTPAWGEAKDMCSFFTPGKVIPPFLVSGMEKRRENTSFWIYGLGLIAFENVASGAGAAQIGAIRGTAFGTRPPMIRFEPDGGDKGGSPAVFTSFTQRVQPAPEMGRDVFPTHWARARSA